MGLGTAPKVQAIRGFFIFMFAGTWYGAEGAGYKGIFDLYVCWDLVRIPTESDNLVRTNWFWHIPTESDILVRTNWSWDIPTDSDNLVRIYQLVLVHTN